MIRVIICDDHAMIRRGIRETLSEAVDIQVTAEAGNYAEVREAVRTKECDVLVLDLNLPGRGGLEVLSSLKESDSPIKVLIVSMFAEDQYAIRCLRAGAQGYLNKGRDPSEFITAIRTIAKGRKYVTADVAQMLVDSLSTPENQLAHSSLSEREFQTLIKIASCKTTLRHCRRTDAKPENSQCLSRTRPGKAKTHKQRRVDSLCHTKRISLKGVEYQLIKRSRVLFINASKG
jgi:DNA-binding NarL/FixJ family response regulator